MKGTWQELRIGDLGRIVTGKTPSTKHPSYFGSEFPFITPSDMVGQKRADITKRYLSSEGAKLLRKNIIPDGCVAVSCIGWQMGKVIMTSRPSFTNQQLNTIIPNEKINANFLYYALSVRKEELLSLGSGTGVRTPILNKSAFSDLKVILPPFPVQRKMAEVLSAYDDLIENNTRRIQLLEQMAWSIFHEWFGKVEVQSLPEGWEVCKIGGLINFVKGKKPKTTSPTGETPLLLIESLRNGAIEFTDDPAMVIAETNDVIMVMDGASSGAVYVGNYGAVGSTLGRYRPKDRQRFSHYHFYFSILKNLKQISDNNIGSAIPHANKDFINQLDIYLPPYEIETQFSEQVAPIFELVSLLHKKNANLRRTRDLLLPRLVSGEIDVENLEIIGEQ
jgi:type I restriction enzyme S subunit